VETIFNLDHIFIVFNPGSGGNFIAGIANSLINASFDSPLISSAGSSHTVKTDNKAAGTDFLSFGTLTEEHTLFPTADARINYYLENIRNNYTSVTTPQVVWTHDFTNIPIYKRFFKNARILVITTHTDRECLTSLIMNTLKTLLDEQANIPLTKQHWENAVSRWKEHCVPEMKKLVGSSNIDQMLSDRFNPVYRDTIALASIRTFLRYYGMVSLVEDVNNTERMVFNNVLYPPDKQGAPYKIGESIYSYLDQDCVILPYSYLSDNDDTVLLDRMTALIQRELTEEEQGFVKTSLYKYRLAQNQTLLEDPRKFYNDLKSKVNNKT